MDTITIDPFAHLRANLDVHEGREVRESRALAERAVMCDPWRQDLAFIASVGARRVTVETPDDRLRFDGVRLARAFHDATGNRSAHYAVRVTLYATTTGELVIVVNRVVEKPSDGALVERHTVSVGVAVTLGEAERLLRNKRGRMGPASREAWDTMLRAAPTLGRAWQAQQCDDDHGGPNVTRKSR